MSNIYDSNRLVSSYSWVSCSLTGSPMFTAASLEASLSIAIEASYIPIWNRATQVFEKSFISIYFIIINNGNW